MQPTIIRRPALLIAGLTGDGSQTGALWNELDRKYGEKPFPKSDECGYEIRLYGGSQPIIPGRDIHAGFAAAGGGIGGFDAVALPEGDYAAFDVLVANGYDSGNAAMDKWLADNAAVYGQREVDGRLFVMECFNEKFKGGNQPDSVVEIWVPIYRKDK